MWIGSDHTAIAITVLIGVGKHCLPWQFLHQWFERLICLGCWTLCLYTVNGKSRTHSEIAGNCWGFLGIDQVLSGTWQHLFSSVSILHLNLNWILGKFSLLVIKHWSSLLRGVMESLSLEVFRKCVGVVLGGTWISSGPGSAGLMFGLNFPTFMFQWLWLCCPGL